MVNLNNGFWTEKKVEQLKKLIAEGLSFGQIAPLIGISRNACIGKAKRLGIQQVLVPKAASKKIPKPPTPVEKSIPTPTHRTSFTANKKVLRVHLPVELEDDDSFWSNVNSLQPRQSSITNIPNAFSCKYISGDIKAGTGKWCGNPAIAGTPWCKKHLARMYAPSSAYGRLKPPSMKRKMSK